MDCTWILNGLVLTVSGLELSHVYIYIYRDMINTHVADFTERSFDLLHGSGSPCRFSFTFESHHETHHTELWAIRWDDSEVLLDLLCDITKYNIPLYIPYPFWAVANVFAMILCLFAILHLFITTQSTPILLIQLWLMFTNASLGLTVASNNVLLVKK